MYRCYQVYKIVFGNRKIESRCVSGESVSALFVISIENIHSKFSTLQ